MSNVTTLLDAKSVPEAKAALVCPARDETYSYKRLRDEMNRVGLGLKNLGVKKGDRVCIYLDSTPEYLISYFAIWRIGAVAVPTNIVYKGRELLHVIHDAGACAVITDEQGVRVLAGIKTEIPNVSHIVCVSGSCEGSGAWASVSAGPCGNACGKLRCQRSLSHPVYGRNNR
jgi:long-chain acyl-CoA synthetase